MRYWIPSRLHIFIETGTQDQVSHLIHEADQATHAHHCEVSRSDDATTSKEQELCEWPALVK